MNPSEIIQKLKATSSSNEKIELIIKNDGELIRKVYTYALDPYLVFGIKALPKYKIKQTKVAPHQTYEDMFDLLNKLLLGTIKGNKATEACSILMEKATDDVVDVFQRIIAKDLKCGVGTKVVNKAYKEAKIPFSYWIPTFEPMAAHLYDIKKAKYACYAEPKLDGMRCVYFIENDKDGNKVALCYSRGGKEIETLDAITKEILELYAINTVVDGEVITRGHFEDAMSIIKRKKENAKEGEIFFNVFDVLTVEEWENQKCDLPLRLRKINRFHKKDTKFVKTVPYIIVNNEDEAMAFYEECIDKGYPYEGSMLKDMDSPYEFKRSNAWLKIKPEETVDVEISGWYEGEAGTKNEGRLGGFIVDYIGSKGLKKVRVGGGYKEKDPTDEYPDLVNQRKLFWEEKEDMLGDLMEMKFMEETKDGSVRHPRFIRLRSYKGEKC